jgi:hypothetical protein
MLLSAAPILLTPIAGSAKEYSCRDVLCGLRSCFESAVRLETAHAFPLSTQVGNNVVTTTPKTAHFCQPRNHETAFRLPEVLHKNDVPI